MPTSGGGKPVKKTTKRGPTRAAALKALGLTQTDLDALKAVAAARDASNSDSERAALESLVGHSLSPKDEQVPDERFVSPPIGVGGQDPQAALEYRQAPTQETWNAPETTEEPVWYARNLRGVEVNFRLTRQQATGEKRTHLNPRGARGDMIRLETRDLKDPELQTQVGFQLIEVIPEGEALAAIKKQYTNQQTQVPSHIAMLRNPKGEEYAQANPVQFASDEEAYGIKVQDLDPRLMRGELSDKEIKRDAGFSQGIIQPVQNPSPGRIIEDGFMAPTQSEDRSNNVKQAEVDAKLRAKQFEDRPEDNLGVSVTLEPTRKVQ